MLEKTKSQETPVPHAAPSEATSDGLLVSEFIAEIRAQFIGAGAKPTYPGVAQDIAVPKVIEELPEALEAMLSVREDGANFPATATAGSALELVIAAAKKTGWPKKTSSIPEEWRKTDTDSNRTATFRRYEIASAINIMIQAYNRNGSGGGSTDFPPEKP
jgi:hypothetical protein